MRTSFSIACMCMAANALAFDWANMKESFLQTALGEEYESHPVYQWHGTNRRTVREGTLRKHHARKIKPLSVHHRNKAINARHTMMARRERLGMAKVGFASPQVSQAYDELNSWSGFTLNVLKGMSYTTGGDSKCYDAFEDIIIGIDTFGDIFKKVYIPAYAPEIQVQLQDMTALTAGFYVDCALDQFFNQMTHLVSSEGVTEISGRVAGAYFFEIAQAQKVYTSEPNTFPLNSEGKYDGNLGKQYYGKALSIILNYTI